MDALGSTFASHASKTGEYPTLPTRPGYEENRRMIRIRSGNPEPYSRRKSLDLHPSPVSANH